MSTIEKLSSFLSAGAALGAMIVSYLNLKKIHQVHVLINSRMTELLKVTGLASKAEGREEERDRKVTQRANSPN